MNCIQHPFASLYLSLDFNFCNYALKNNLAVGLDALDEVHKPHDV